MSKFRNPGRDPRPPLPINVESLIDRGHYDGKLGHYNGRVRKERVLQDQRALGMCIFRMCEDVVAFEPTLLVGQQTGGARLASMISYHTGVPAVPLEKPPMDRVPPYVNRQPITNFAGRIVIVEDTVISGKSLYEVRNTLQTAGMDANLAVSLFDNTNVPPEQLGLAGFAAAITPDIQVWAPEECIMCDPSRAK